MRAATRRRARTAAVRGAACAGLAALALLLPAAVRAQGCSARSADRVAPLVELYVSGGCESCPQAERWLRALASSVPVGKDLVAILLPADTGGATAPASASDIAFAMRERARRVHRQARLGRARPLLVPLVLLQGRERGDWRLPRFERALASLQGYPAPLRMRLDVESAAGEATGMLDVRAEVRSPASSHLGPLALYLGVFQASAGSPEVRDGPAGRPVYRVENWVGPIAIPSGGTWVERRLLPAAAGASASGVAGFVQRASREVVQALARPPCSARAREPETGGGHGSLSASG